MPLIIYILSPSIPASRLDFASAGGFAICDLRCAFPASAGIAARPSCPRRAWFDAQPSTCSSSSARGCAAPAPLNLGALTGGVSASGACMRAARRQPPAPSNRGCASLCLGRKPDLGRLNVFAGAASCRKLIRLDEEGRLLPGPGRFLSTRNAPGRGGSRFLVAWVSSLPAQPTPRAAHSPRNPLPSDFSPPSSPSRGSGFSTLGARYSRRRGLPGGPKATRGRGATPRGGTAA